MLPLIPLRFIPPLQRLQHEQLSSLHITPCLLVSSLLVLPTAFLVSLHSYGDREQPHVAITRKGHTDLLYQNDEALRQDHAVLCHTSNDLNRQRFGLTNSIVKARGEAGGRMQEFKRSLKRMPLADTYQSSSMLANIRENQRNSVHDSQGNEASDSRASSAKHRTAKDEATNDLAEHASLFYPDPGDDDFMPLARANPGNRRSENVQEAKPTATQNSHSRSLPEPTVTPATPRIESPKSDEAYETSSLPSQDPEDDDNELTWLEDGMSRWVENHLYRMHILVDTMGGRAVRLEIRPSDTIHDFKRLIQEKQGLAIERQRLTFLGIRLDDGRTLSDYDIRDRSGLYLRW